MHSRDPTILHRDLKPGNILIKGSPGTHPLEWTAKVADMGESREYRKGDNLSMVGTPYFCCPEMVMCEDYNEAADVYSFGVLLFDMVTYKVGGVFSALWGETIYPDCSRKGSKALNPTIHR